MNRQLVGYGILLALMLVAPAVLYPVLVMKILCFALFACAFNLLIGFTGLLSFGHAVFLGTAGYVAGHSIKVWGFPPELGLIAAALAAAALGWEIGSLAIRRSGIYFAMITLALAQMMYFFFLQAPLTGGEDDKLLGYRRRRLQPLLFRPAIFVFAFWRPSPSIRPSPVLSRARAISPATTWRNTSCWPSFPQGAGWPGTGVPLATLTDAHWHTSGEVVPMTLGGMGTVFGRCAATIVTLQNSWPTGVALSPSSWGRSCVLAFAAASSAKWGAYRR